MFGTMFGTSPNPGFDASLHVYLRLPKSSTCSRSHFVPESSKQGLRGLLSLPSEMLGRIQCLEEDSRCGPPEGGSDRIYWVIIPFHPPLEKGDKDIKEEAMETIIPTPIFIGINSSGNPGCPFEAET